MLENYRVFRTSPSIMYMDFCSECEKRFGTLTLYRRYSSYATKEIAQAVFSAAAIAPELRSGEQTRLVLPPVAAKEPSTKEEVVQIEIARRELARRRLVYFTTTFQPDYRPGWVHQDMCRRLEKFVRDVERGKSPRLMIACPPRTGKSLLASDMFPSWVLGRHPNWGIIGASYAISLPTDFSRNIRDRIRDPEYAVMFPDTAMRKDSQGIESWKTTKGGGYIAAGVGVGINGKGMHIGIADDLIKDQEAAQSEAIRESTFGWYQSVFRTRLAPGGGILYISTRWHDSDPAGKLLEKEELLRKEGVPEDEIEGWDVVSYPAIAEHDEYLLSTGAIWRGTPPEGQEKARLLRHKGEALHPERYPVSELKKIKNTLTPMLWSALYQQNPTPDDGEFFRRSDFRYRVINKDYLSQMRVFITADFAISTRTSRKDWTVLGVFALSAEDDLFVLDIARGRWQITEIVNNIVSFVAQYKPEVFAGERGSIYEAVWPLVRQELDKKRLYVSFDESLVPIQDKEVRARPLQGRMQRHKLIFSYSDTTRPAIYDETEKELLRFPNGTHDDIVDALAWGARMALNTSLPSGQAAPKPMPSWKDRYRAASASTSFMRA